MLKTEAWQGQPKPYKRQPLPPLPARKGIDPGGEGFGCVRQGCASSGAEAALPPFFSGSCIEEMFITKKQKFSFVYSIKKTCIGFVPSPPVWSWTCVCSTELWYQLSFSSVAGRANKSMKWWLRYILSLLHWYQWPWELQNIMLKAGFFSIKYDKRKKHSTMPMP